MRVLIVDDSALVRNILKEVFKGDSGVTITGEATNGVSAIELNRELSPELIIMDINMPKMDGLQATRIIMEEKPVPIIVFSGELDAANSYKAITYGAVDVMRKPDIDKLNDPSFSREFLKKLHTISRVKVQRRDDAARNLSRVKYHDTKYKLVVIGTSTGGPAAIRTLLRKLPMGLPVCFALVQHLESGFDKSYTQWLSDSANMPVELARDNDRLEKGKMFVAPTDTHLVVRGLRFYLEDTEKVLNQKPSVDMLFKTAAESYKDGVIAVLLTGMGNDGANGCVAVREKGGVTLVQDQATSTIFGMPKAAIEKNAATHVLPLDDIPEVILKLLKKV